MITLHTTRLHLRPLLEEDAAWFFKLNKDLEVLKYTGDVPFKTVEESARFLKSYDQYRLYGLGRFAVFNTLDQSPLGWCGIKYCPVTAQYDLGFRFFKSYWNQGFATEASQACIELAKKHPKITQLVGRVHRENKGSIAVLKKLGFLNPQTYNFDGMPGYIFSLPV